MLGSFPRPQDIKQALKDDTSAKCKIMGTKDTECMNYALNMCT